MYRVVAVAVGAVIAATVVVLTTTVGWFVAVPLATVGWIVLAVIQDHDQRVRLDVNSEFDNLLREQADSVLARAGFTFNGADGPSRRGATGATRSFTRPATQREMAVSICGSA